MADGEGHDMDQEVPEELPMPNDVTRKMKINDKVTLQHRLATAMRKSMGGDKEDSEERYDGQNVAGAYRRWERAALQTGAALSMGSLDDVMRNPAVKKWKEDTWNSVYSKTDREFLYEVLMDTLTRHARDTSERTDKNGVLLMRFYYELWGSASISNSMLALHELTTTRVAKHDDPAPTIRQVERIYADFFPDMLDENIKKANLMLIIDRNKYASVFAYAEAQKSPPTYDELKDKVIKHFLRERSMFQTKQQNGDRAPRPQAHVTNPPSGGTPATAGNSSKKQLEDEGERKLTRKRYCKWCKKHVLHPPSQCWHNPQNKKKGHKDDKPRRTPWKFCPVCGSKEHTDPRKCSSGSGKKKAIDARTPKSSTGAVGSDSDSD